MNAKFLVAMWIVCCAACLPAPRPPPPTPPPSQIYFPETQHMLSAPFVDYFRATGGVATHGFPVTESFVVAETGLLVQYFEKSRLEYHPGSSAPYSVHLGLLGEELGQATPPVRPGEGSAANAACQYFEQTGHHLCSLFLEHWLSNGDVRRFGYPISEMTIEDDRLVQWFQRTRLEWHPERPEGRRVILTHTGTRLAADLHIGLYLGTSCTAIPHC